MRGKSRRGDRCRRGRELWNVTSIGCNIFIEIINFIIRYLMTIMCAQCWDGRDSERFCREG